MTAPSRSKTQGVVISRAEKRLLDATVAVRKAIDRHCANGAITSDMPDFERISHIFDVLHWRCEARKNSPNTSPAP